jgi:hypothetical protein
MILVDEKGRIIDVADAEFPVAKPWKWINVKISRDAIGSTWDGEKAIAMEHRPIVKKINITSRIEELEKKLTALEAKK